MALREDTGKDTDAMKASSKKLNTFLKEMKVSNREYITHVAGGEVMSSKEVELTSENHAFWFGKFPARDSREQVKEWIWKKDEEYEKNPPLYTPELVMAVVDYLQKNIQEGEKPQIMMSISLSEIMNGVRDIETSLSKEEEIQLFKKISKKFFGSADVLEIKDIESIPEHAALFKQLREHPDDMGGVDMEKALGGEVISELTPDTENLSLEIAKYLYQGTKVEGKDGKKWLEQKFAECAPASARIKVEDGLAPQSTLYYGLIEAAVRMSEIIRGRTIHGGAARQNRYDEIIQILMDPKNEGKKAWKKLLKAVGPVHNLLRDKNFERVYINTEKNIFLKRSKKTKSLARLAVKAALGVSTIVGLVQYGEYRSAQKHRVLEGQRDAIVRRDVGKKAMATIRKTETIQEKEHLLEKVVSDIKDDLQGRYGYSQSEIDFITLFMKSRLLHSEYSLDYFTQTENLHTFVDAYLDDNALDLVEHGIIQLQPNKLFVEHLERMRDFLQTDRDVTIQIDQELRPGFKSGSGMVPVFYNGKYVGMFPPVNRIQKISLEEKLMVKKRGGRFEEFRVAPLSYVGVYRTPDEYLKTHSKFYALYNFGSHYFALGLDRDGDSSISDMPTSEDGRFVVKQILQEMDRYDTRHFSASAKKQMKHHITPSELQMENKPMLRSHLGQKTLEYKDSGGAFHYEFFEDNGHGFYSENTGLLYARDVQREDQAFTRETALEMAEWFRKREKETPKS